MSGTAGSVMDPHNSMRARDISKVARGEQAPRPTKHASQADTKFSHKQHDDDDDEEEEEEVMETPPDSRHCYTHYLEYQRCTRARGKEAPECRKLAKYYVASCPSELIERWDEQVDKGTYPARI